MGKYFRDISIHTYNGQVLPEEKTQRDFNVSAHTVQDLFYYLIPRPIEFKTITKLNILITDKLVLPKQFSVFPDGIAEFNFFSFDFAAYFRSPRPEQNSLLLALLRDTLTKIGDPQENSTAKLLKVCDKIRENNFALEWESKKMSKQSRNRKYEAKVIFTVDDHGQNARVAILDKNGTLLLEEQLLQNVLFEFSEKLARSQWEGNVFKIVGKDGHVFREYAVG